jgi:3-mercaptopyruvate sulfurtransferase SseA
MDKGFTRVRPLEGGIDAWADAGYSMGDSVDDVDDETVVGVRHSDDALDSSS